jgi:hypothetical protein
MEDSYYPESYVLALTYLAHGAMPVIIDREDGLYVIAAQPTDHETLCYMTSPDEKDRLQLIVKTMVVVKRSVEEGAEA